MNDLEVVVPPAKPAVVEQPQVGQMKQKARLRNWARYPAGGGLQGRNYDHLEGNVYDHPDQYRCPDGYYIGTSKLLWIDLALRLAETRNTVYILEGPPA